MIKCLGKVALTIILFMNVIGPICGLAIWYSDGEGFWKTYLFVCMVFGIGFVAILLSMLVLLIFFEIWGYPVTLPFTGRTRWVKRKDLDKYE